MRNDEKRKAIKIRIATLPAILGFVVERSTSVPHNEITVIGESGFLRKTYAAVRKRQAAVTANALYHQ